MSLKLVSLFSGSKGNATLVFSDKTAILVDAGVSCSRISAALSEFGLTPSALDGVVITHEHTDHIRALPRLSAYTEIYAHPFTAREICVKHGADALKNYREVEDYEGGFIIGDINVQPFRTPHDAAYSLAYTFECGGAKVSVATDIGKPTVGVYKNICDSQIVLLEANHDIDMLRNGRYAPWLKARILGDRGHLSNEGTALIAERLCTGCVHTLLLGHLSENNNLPDLAYGTVNTAIKKHADAELEVYLAYQDRRSEVFETI